MINCKPQVLFYHNSLATGSYSVTLSQHPPQKKTNYDHMAIAEGL